MLACSRQHNAVSWPSHARPRMRPASSRPAATAPPTVSHALYAAHTHCNNSRCAPIRPWPICTWPRFLRILCLAVGCEHRRTGGEHGPAVLAQQQSESLHDRTDGPRSAAVARQPTPHKDKCKACHGGAGGGGEARSRAPGDAARPRYCQGRGSMHRPTARRSAAVGELARRRCDGAGWGKVIGVRTILPLYALSVAPCRPVSTPLMCTEVVRGLSINLPQ